MSPKSKTRQLAYVGYRWVSLPFTFMRNGKIFEEKLYGALRNQPLIVDPKAAAMSALNKAQHQATLGKSY